MGSVSQVNVSGITTTNNLNVTGVGTIRTLAVSGVTTTQNLTVTGVSTIGNVSIGVGNTTLIVTGTARVSGAATFDGGATITSGGLTLVSGANGFTMNNGAGAFTFGPTTANFTAASQTTGTLTLGGPAQTGTIVVGQSTATSILGIGTGASGVGTTKTINLGTGGLSGSFTNINIGPDSGGIGTVIVNSNNNLGIGSTLPTQALDVRGNIAVSGFSSIADTRLNSVSEESTVAVGNTISLAYNTGGGNIGIITNPTGPIALNVIGIPTDNSFNNRVLTFSVIVNQGTIGYSCSSITLNGVIPTIKWPGGIVAAGATSCYDSFNFTCINPIGSASTTSNYVVIGIINGNFK